MIVTRYGESARVGNLAGLKIRSPQGGVGSSPTFGTLPTARESSQLRATKLRLFPSQVPHHRRFIRLRRHASIRPSPTQSVPRLLPKLLPTFVSPMSQMTPIWPP